MNGIDYSKLRSLTAREIVSALIKDGFYLVEHPVLITNFFIQTTEG